MNNICLWGMACLWDVSQLPLYPAARNYKTISLPLYPKLCPLMLPGVPAKFVGRAR